MSEFIRTEMLIGKEALEKLRKASVAIFGIGGVGSYVCEAAARSGIGSITLIDNDVVSESNINRQLIALHSTIGCYKTEAAKRRIEDINPECQVKAVNAFYSYENAQIINFSEYDYIIDAIDTVTAKLCLIENTYKVGIPIISSMGTGNKLDPMRFRISDISKTSVCPLARVMRRELKNRGITKLKVLWSDEVPKKPLFEGEINSSRRQTPASVAFVPSVAGLLIAKEMITDLIK